ncbi:MAG TPA: M50 family metallopeptidase [Actinopolymorphaceae bacterium]
MPDVLPGPRFGLTVGPSGLAEVSMPELERLWAEVTGVQPQPAVAVVLICAAAGFAAVAITEIWRWSRHVVTIAHEGGHALVAVLVGRRLSGIRLHSDTSGVTISRGKPTGPGMVATTMAGYVAPPVIGVGYSAMLANGRIVAILWISIVALLAMLIVVRNAYGALTLVTTAVAIFVVSWFAPAPLQAAVAYSFTWFLLFAGIRPVVELQRKRARRMARDSDADQLARLTRLPGLVWVMVFGLVSLGALVLGARWLLPWQDLPLLEITTAG